MMDKIDILALKLIDGIGLKSLKNLVDSGHNPVDLSSMDEDELGQYIKGPGKKNAVDHIKNHFLACQEKAERLIDELRSNEIVIISYWDNDYPNLYKLIDKPPVFLYLKGDKSLLHHKSNIAIIGTRDCTDIGKKIAGNTARYFSENGFNIVSGLAIGIDTAAHKGALDANGKTTAIVVDVQKIYPFENIKLAEEILQSDGLLVSENPPGTIQHSGLLISRDRLQSGLSLGVFPIETDVVGGTMHTVQFAKDQKRLLFCPDLNKIPDYSLTDKQCQGVLKLINESVAEPYSKDDYDDIIRKLNEKQSVLFSSQDSDVDLPPSGQSLRIKGI
jgi:DNA processing protein